MVRCALRWNVGNELSGRLRDRTAREGVYSIGGVYLQTWKLAPSSSSRRLPKRVAHGCARNGTRRFGAPVTPPSPVSSTPSTRSKISLVQELRDDLGMKNGTDSLLFSFPVAPSRSLLYIYTNILVCNATHTRCSLSSDVS